MKNVISAWLRIVAIHQLFSNSQSTAIVDVTNLIHDNKIIKTVKKKV